MAVTGYRVNWKKNEKHLLSSRNSQRNSHAISFFRRTVTQPPSSKIAFKMIIHYWIVDGILSQSKVLIEILGWLNYVEKNCQERQLSRGAFNKMVNFSLKLANYRFRLGYHYF